MDQNNGNDQTAGDAGVASPGAPDSGTQGGDTTSTTANPQGQDGNAPVTDADRIKALEGNVRGLNKALIESRREGRQKITPGDNPDTLP